jgi:hypothetical protein
MEHTAANYEKLHCRHYRGYGQNVQQAFRNAFKSAENETNTDARE